MQKFCQNVLDISNNVTPLNVVFLVTVISVFAEVPQ